MKVISDEGNKIRFVIDKATPELVNSIRVAAVFKTPVLAIEDVYFTKNNSVMYDEQIAIRLGLIPLKASDKVKEPIKVTLKAKGPRMVYAKDLQAEGAEVLYPETPIVWLEETHEIDLTANAVFGIGSQHAKWNTGWMFYQHYPKITVKDKTGAKEAVKHCPRKVFNGIEIENVENCNLCRACQDYSDGAVQVTEVGDKFIVTLESWGQLTPKEILAKATEIVEKDLDELKLK